MLMGAGAKFVYRADYSAYGLEEVPLRVGFGWKREVVTADNYGRVMGLVRGTSSAAIDVETTSLEAADTELVAVNLSVLDGAGEILSFVAFYSPSYLQVHARERLGRFPSRYRVLELVRAALHVKFPVFHNRIFDQRVLLHQADVPMDAVTAADDFRLAAQSREGDAGVRLGQALGSYDFARAYDTLALFFQMDSNVMSGLSLKDLGQKYLGIPMEHFDEAVGEDILWASPKTLLDYGSLDTYVTLALFRRIAPSFRRVSPFLFALQPQFATALYDLEEARHDVDLAVARGFSEGVMAEVEALKREFFDSYGVINLGSNLQKSRLLMSLGYFTGEWSQDRADGEKVMSVKSGLLEKLVKETGCPPAKMMVDYNKLVKLNSSYFDSLLSYAGKAGANNVRFHVMENRVPTLRLAAGKQTIGRKASGYFIPINMMAIPKPHYVCRGLDFDEASCSFRLYDAGDVQAGQYWVETGDDVHNFRSCFVPPEGYVFVQADFSAEELRMLAGFSGERVWVDAFNQGKDIHDQTAREVYGLAADAHVDKNLRKMAKFANFSLAYALPGSSYTLVHLLGMGEAEAVKFEEDYRKALPALYAWKEGLYRQAVVSGHCKNYYGHVRTVRRYVETRSRHWVDFAKKTAVSNAIQGSCGVIIRLLVVLLWRRLYGPQREYNKGVSGEDLHDPSKCDISWFLPIHDEMSLVVRRELVPEAVTLLTGLMESLTPKGFPVRLVADPSIGADFGHLVPVDVVDGKIRIREEARPSAADVAMADGSDGDDAAGDGRAFSGGGGMEELGGFAF